MTINRTCLLGMICLLPFTCSAGSMGPVSEPTSWQGFYVGANAGVGYGDSSMSTSVPTTQPSNFYFGTVIRNDVNSIGSINTLISNGVFGAQAGYNYQINHLVIGLEAIYDRINWSSQSMINRAYPSVPPSVYTINQSFTSDWIVDILPRIGIASNNVLAYATGGYAVADMNYTGQFTDNLFGGTIETAAISKNKSGWAAGAGVEYKLSSNLSLRGLYLYNDLGSITTTSNNLVTAAGTIPVPNEIFTHKTSFKIQTFTLGLNWLF